MPLSLPDRPQIVATVTQESDLAFLQSNHDFAGDILEFRIDDLISHREETAETMRHSPLPALLTVRRPDEGGAGALSDEDRLGLYEEFLPRATLVDTEIASLVSETFSGFLPLAAENGVPVVASVHDFHRYPGTAFLREQADRARELGVDIVKFAVVVGELDELFALAGLVEDIRGSGGLVSAMGMGPLGKLSRLVLAKAGSCLNYGYLRTSNAPGQWSADELARLIGEI